MSLVKIAESNQCEDHENDLRRKIEMNVKTPEDFDNLDTLILGIRLTSEAVKDSCGKNSLRSFGNEQFKKSDLNKKSRKETTVETWRDSDEEFSFELEKAVKKYKDNRKKIHSVEEESNLESQKINCEGSRYKGNTKSRASRAKSQNPRTDKLQLFINTQNNDGKNISADIQKLFNYFGAPEKDEYKKPAKNTYSDYVKQGAIPKNKLRNDSNEYASVPFKSLKANPPQKNKTEKQKVNKSVSNHDSENKPRSDKVSIFQNKPSVDASRCDDTVTLSEEVCSGPFFYIVPKNPSPNFLFSSGSYYIIPKDFDVTFKGRVIFHPVKAPSIECGTNDVESRGEKDFTAEPNVSLGLRHPKMNNLDKSTVQKEDSHLNIGPSDVKLSDFSSNLEAVYCSPQKIYEKIVASPRSGKASEVPQKTMFSSLAKFDRINFRSDKRKLTKDMEEIEVEETVFLETEESDEDREVTVVQPSDSSRPGEELQQLEKNLESVYQALKCDGDSEDSGDSNQDSFDDTEEDSSDHSFDDSNDSCDHNLETKNLADPEGLDFKISEQFDKMVSALPEISATELWDKCVEFQGNQELGAKYIQESKRLSRMNQRLVDLQLIIPDADPDFLRREVEQLNDNEPAFNDFIDNLLSEKNYPKVPELRLESEKRKKLWQTYVENFSIKNFVLQAPEPEKFAGRGGDNNKTDPELVLKFLVSRYPELEREFLQETFELYDKNITKTCEHLGTFNSVSLLESSFKYELFDEAFLKEVCRGICYIDHRKEIDDYLKEVKELKETERHEARINKSFLSCPLCCDDELIASEAVTCPEGHIFCEECIKRYFNVKLADGIYKYACPSENCDAFFSYETLRKLLADTVLLRIMKKQQAEEISIAEVDGLEFCPYCEFAYIPNTEDVLFKCQNPECLIETCRKCHEKNHIPLRCEEVEKSVDVAARQKIEEAMTNKLVRTCPNCKKKFVKIDGCNKMQCTCGTIICYICRCIINGYNHFKENNFKKKCPLYSDNQYLHEEEVYKEGTQVRDQILSENPNINILYDPTARKIH